MWIDVGKLIREQFPDKNGKLLPQDLTSGSYQLRDLSDKASNGVHSSWRYRLLSAEMDYSISDSSDHDADLKIAEWAVKWDITANTDLQFWRALVSARFGKMDQAKADLKFILATEPENPSYRALAAYIGVLAGDRSQLEAFRGHR